MPMTTAETSFASHRFIPLSTAKAREWVAALPLADPGETTRRLFHGLVDLNRRALPPQTRLAISELLRPAVDVALENLQRHLVARAFPLTQKTQKIFELTQSLMLEFAGSWQLAVLDMLTKQEGGKKLLQEAIYRALDYMGRVLVLTYAVYVRTRETLWHDIHHLYLLAAEHGLEQVKIRNASPGAPTIEARYLQLNVLALAKPYSLRQGEAQRLMHYLTRHTALLGMRTEAPEKLRDSVHVAILNSDEPAVLMPASDLPHSPTVRILDLDGLVALLDQYIRNTEKLEGASALVHEGLSRNLAKRIIYHLTTMRNRSFNRFPKNEKVGMVTRMSDVLTVLRDSQNQDARQEQQEQDFLFNVYVSGHDQGSDEVRKPVVKADNALQANIQTWKVINSSVGGYGLCWEGQETSGARVGEVVGLRDMRQDQAVWMIGVIKWLEFVAGKGLCCGVELLSTKAMVLRVKQVINRAVQQTLPVDGLMLPSIEGMQPDPALLLPAYMFQPGDEIRVDFAEREERVRLLGLDECLGVFAYFRFNNLTEKPARNDEDDFTALWQSL